MQHARSLRRAALLVLSLLSACAAANPSAGVAVARRHDVSGAAAAYLIARYAAQSGDLATASSEFMRALAVDPANKALQQEAFLTALLAGRPEATELARDLPLNPAADLLLGDEAVKAGQWAEAQKQFAALPANGVTDLLRPILIAWAEQGAGQTAAALTTLKPLVEGTRFRGVYALHAAVIADLGGDIPQAGRLYGIAQASSGGPNLALARVLASWQARQGQTAAAQATLAALATANPDLAIAIPGLQAKAAERQIRGPADGVAEAYLALAAALHVQDSSEFSAILLHLALDLQPNLTPARLLNAEIYQTGNHLDRALASLSAVAGSDPLAPLVRLRVAALRSRMDDNKAALGDLAQLARQFPRAADIPSMQGDIQRIEGHFSDAVAAYDRAVALIGTPGPQNWALFYDRGIALERAHQWPRAKADLQTALRLSPNQPYVLNYLGYSMTERGENLAEAHKLIERAAEQRPNDGAIIDSLGWVELRQGNVKGAVRLLERAVELDAEDSTVSAHLGDAYWAAGRKLEAQFQWRRSLTLKPDPEQVAKLRARLRDGNLSLRAAVPVNKAVQ
ncbi:MAG: tetratricopeptide repeat protein [Rhodospirillales bacterium]|nr:tetratricopeptide repeat protein [Rhodospirillales bacterium]